MFSLACVLLPFSDVPPADAISASLARFERGRRGGVPDDWLTFHDETAHVEELHRAVFTFTRAAGLETDGGDSWSLNTRAIIEAMEARALDCWTVSLSDIEPDVTRFAARFLRPYDRHPVTGGFGHWLNPLGRWDYWELGGRFDGVITRQPRRPERLRSGVTSGPNRVRDAIDTLTSALADALDQTLPEIVDVETDANIELVSRLREDVDIDEQPRWPGVLVLPPDTLPDPLRWLRNWPETGPADTVLALSLATDASWGEIVRAAYDRFDDCWAAGVAFHH